MLASRARGSGAEHVFKYLGRYTHRVGISNHRIQSMDDDGRVTFATKNGQTITLPGVEFLSRLLAHVLPDHFVKIRHSGLLAASNVNTTLEIARELLRARASPDSIDASAKHAPTTTAECILALLGIDVQVCRRCGARTLERRPLPTAQLPAPPDTS